MRTVSDEVSVRLYYLDEGDGGAQTLCYGTLVEAMAIARNQPEDVQAGLFLATENDVVAWTDFEPG